MGSSSMFSVCSFSGIGASFSGLRGEIEAGTDDEDDDADDVVDAGVTEGATTVGEADEAVREEFVAGVEYAEEEEEETAIGATDEADACNGLIGVAEELQFSQSNTQKQHMCWLYLSSFELLDCRLCPPRNKLPVRACPTPRTACAVPVTIAATTFLLCAPIVSRDCC